MAWRGVGEKFSSVAVRLCRSNWLNVEAATSSCCTGIMYRTHGEAKVSWYYDYQFRGHKCPCVQQERGFREKSWFPECDSKPGGGDESARFSPPPDHQGDSVASFPMWQQWLYCSHLLSLTQHNTPSVGFWVIEGFILMLTCGLCALPYLYQNQVTITPLPPPRRLQCCCSCRCSFCLPQAGALSELI